MSLSFHVGNAENGDLIVRKDPYARSADLDRSSDWHVMSGDRKPSGGDCLASGEKGWAIWDDLSFAKRARRLYILDLAGKRILDPEGFPLLGGALREPWVFSTRVRHSSDSQPKEWATVVVSDLDPGAEGRRLVKDVVIVSPDTAKLVGRFRIDGVGEHILSALPPMPEGLTPLEQQAFRDLQWYSSDPFKAQIIKLIEKSELARAEEGVLEAIQIFASEPLKVASRIDDASLRIVGWNELCADLFEANEKMQTDFGKTCTFAVLRVYNRTGGAVDERLTMGRSFYAAFAKDLFGRISANWDLRRIWRDEDHSLNPIWIEGLEQITAIHRRPTRAGVLTEDETRQLRIDNLLAGLLLVVKYHRLIDRTLEREGLPCSVAIQIRAGETARGYEANIQDHNTPDPWRFIAALAPTASSRNTVATTLARRKADLEACDKLDVIAMVAQLRESYRIVRLFPFYRFWGRRNFARYIDSILAACCSGQDLPQAGVGWRMSKPRFEALLHQVVEKRGHSVKEVLDPAHVDRLHDKWLAEARKSNFELRPSPSFSLFEGMLSYALSTRAGGPILQDRWERLGPYVP